MAASSCQDHCTRSAVDDESQRSKDHKRNAKLQHRGAVQVGRGAETFLVQRSRGDGSECHANRRQAGYRDGVDIDLVAYHRRNTPEPERDASPLPECERLVQSLRRDERGQKVAAELGLGR